MNPVYGGMPTYITVVSGCVRRDNQKCLLCESKQNSQKTGMELVGKICQVYPRCCYSHSSIKKLRGTISFHSFSLPFTLP
jgi:hypothetical protein